MLIPEVMVAGANNGKPSGKDKEIMKWKIGVVWEMLDIPKTGEGEGGEDYDWDDVRKAYKKLAKKYHPDKWKPEDEGVRVDIYKKKTKKGKTTTAFSASWESKDERFKVLKSIYDILEEDIDLGVIVLEHKARTGEEGSTDVFAFEDKSEAVDYIKEKLKELKKKGWIITREYKEKKEKKKKKKHFDWLVDYVGLDLNELFDDILPEDTYMEDDGGVKDSLAGIKWRDDGKYYDDDAKKYVATDKGDLANNTGGMPKKIKDFFKTKEFKYWKEKEPQEKKPQEKEYSKPKFKTGEAGKLSTKQTAEAKAYIHEMMAKKQGKFKW